MIIQTQNGVIDTKKLYDELNTAKIRYIAHLTDEVISRVRSVLYKKKHLNERDILLIKTAMRVSKLNVIIMKREEFKIIN